MSKLDSIHFLEIGRIEMNMLEKWTSKVFPASLRQSEFLNIVKEGLDLIDYDFKIATVEPYINAQGEIDYDFSKDISFLKATCWEEKAKEFYSTEDWQSGLATIYELYVFYALRVATDMWTLEEVCDRTYGGNYRAYDGTVGTINQAGATFETGGFYDGIGNTYKLVLFPNPNFDSDRSFAIVGGSYRDCGEYTPAANLVLASNNSITLLDTTGVVVIRHR